MHPNQEINSNRIIANGPDGRRETVTETRRENLRRGGLSFNGLAALALIALTAIGLTIYVVRNKNANDEANRQAILEASRMKEAQSRQPSTAPSQQPIIIQQPAPQAPVIVQPPAAPTTQQSARQAPVTVQPPSAPTTQSKGSAVEDAAVQDAAAKRLADDPSLSAISVTVINGNAVLTGTVDSPDLKARAEKVVKSVRGVKTVENMIDVAKQ
jgi:hypothetical protein